MVKIANPHTGKEYEFQIGADPEVFVKNSSGNLVSAYGLIKGDKKDPFKVKNGAVQVDGMALEFNIDPAKDFDSFNRNLDTVLETLKSMVPDYELAISPVAEFGKEYIEKQPKEAKELGCDPDFDAYTGKANPRPDGEQGFRTASGHIHIGWTEGVDPNNPTHLEACKALVKNLDTYVGLPSLVWESLLGDKEDKRRKLYGKAGAFRPKPYGLEYRVLSNTWLLDRAFRKCVFENTLTAIKKTFEDFTRAGIKRFPLYDTENSVLDENGKTVQSLSTKDILDKKPGWEAALAYALEYEDIRPSYFYRKIA